jgi:Rrf2 family iron-sulfur cluster assembly transcriptional regulator
MILSTKGRYAVMAMVDLATQSGEKPVGLASIAERQQIPLAYLEQIFARLKKSGLVQSVRGPGGGYFLAREADEMNIAEIMYAAGEPIKMTRCDSESHKGCMAHKARCLTHDLWEGLTAQMRLYLGSITLADVCVRRVQEKFPRAHAMPELMMFAKMAGDKRVTKR